MKDVCNCHLTKNSWKKMDLAIEIIQIKHGQSCNASGLFVKTFEKTSPQCRVFFDIFFALVVRALDSQSRGPVSELLPSSKVDLAFYPFKYQEHLGT